MKQYTITYNSLGALDLWLESLDTQTASSVLVQLFSGLFDQEEELKEILQKLNKKLPNTTIIGSSTAGELIGSSLQDETIVISVSVFEKTTLKSFSYISEDSYALGCEVARSIVSEKTKAVIIFVDGLSCNGDALLKGFSENSANPDVVVAGGLAGDNRSFTKTYIIESENIFSGGVVAVALDSEELLVHSSYNLSWKPIGLEMCVTKADGNKIYEIDNRPVVDIYHEYLGDGIVENMPDSAIEFPLIFEQQGVLIARSIIAVDDDYVMYAGEILEGTKVRLGIASRKMFEDSRIELYRKNAALAVESFYVYSCIARRALLGKEIEEELILLDDIAPLSGFVTYGELYTQNSDYKMLNITTTVLALSETDTSSYKYCHAVLEEKKESLSTSALIHLVDKTVANLEKESVIKENTIAQLNQYQKAINSTYIVSIADINGDIVDVNEKFLEVSGYSKEELIGKKHRVIRHPDMPAETFEELWRTITNKQIWQGAIKNRSKSGKAYYVNATIFPILDKDQNIVEYAAVRDNITKVFEEKERAEAILNAQNSIVLLTSRKGSSFVLKQLNKKFFDLFDYKDSEDFLSKHECICDLFIEREGYLGREVNGKAWLDYTLENSESTHLVLMEDKFKFTHIFSLRVQKVNLGSEEFVISTFTDVTELEEARIEAQAAEKAKGAFLSMMSHELRTPLNAVIGFSQIMMQKKDLTFEQIQTFVEKINISGNHLLQLVNNILDFSKMESEHNKFYQEDSNLYLLLSESVTLVEILASDKGIEINKNIPKDTKIFGDQQLFKQLFLNLLSNAVKFTPKQKNIYIEFQEDEECKIISVRDEGFGIPAEDLKHIFEPFSQVKEHQHQSIKGTGLGLAICKKIVELHNGRIEVKSEVEKGTSFSVYLPKKEERDGRVYFTKAY